MYKEPHLQRNLMNVHALWYEWERLSFDKLGTKDLWNECCDEFSKLLEEEVRTNPRYIEFKDLNV